MLLEASRRLREQSQPLNSVDREGYYGCSTSPSGSLDAAGVRSGMRIGLDPNGGNSFRKPMAAAVMAQPAASAAPLPAVDIAEGAGVASFGSLAAASATTAARLAAVRLAAVNVATGPTAAAAVAAAAQPPSASAEATAAADAGTAAGRPAMTAAAATASAVAAAAAMPHAASASASSASAASSAASVVSSGWLAIEEMLEEAAYSLSQELPGGQASSPLDALLAASTTTTSFTASSGSGLSMLSGPGSAAASALGPLGGMTGELPAGLGLGLSESVAALPDLGLGRGLSSAAGVGSGLMAAVPGGDRLSEMLEDLLYSLSQDINLGATQEAVAAAAVAAAAGLAGAAAELPRAAASVYRSAADAAAAAAAARASSARGATGGGSGGTALVVPEEVLGEEYDVEPYGEWSSVYDNGAQDPPSDAVNPPWDPYGTIRAAEGAAGTASVNSDAVGAAASSATSAAAAAEGAATTLPIVTASSAPTVAEAATATAAAVVEAATTAAAGTIVLDARTALPPPPLAAAPPAVAGAVEMGPSGGLATDSDGGLYGTDPDSAQQLDELTAALQSLLAVPEGTSSSAAAMSGLDAAAGAAVAAAGQLSPLDLGLGRAPPTASSAASEAEAALSSLTEALRRELGAAVGGASEAVDADPSALAAAAGQAVSSALSSLSLSLEQGQGPGVDLSSLPPDLRLSTLLGAVLQASLDLVESALGGVRSADSTLVGGVTIAAVMALLIRSLVSLAGAAVSRSREVAGAGALGPGGGAEAGRAAARMRPVGVTALEAAAALNNDPQALLLDIRTGSDVSEQGLPDLRPFRRGAGAATVPLPYCDFRTIPTLANPSGSLLATPPAPSPAASASALLAPLASGAVTVSVDPMFASKFKQLEGLDRDSRVFLLDSYGVEAPEAVLLLRSDPELERLLGAQGIKFVEGGFAGPEGWKLTGLPVMDAPLPESAQGEAGAGSRPVGLELDFSGLLNGVAGLRLRYPSLFTRTLAVGAAGGAGVAVASSLDWGAVSRGAVGLAAAMLLTDRVLPPGVRPSGRIRQYLQAQLSESQLGSAAPSSPSSAAASSSGGLLPPRRRIALLLRALDLAEMVGDAVVRAGGSAVVAVGSAARGAIARRAGAADTDTPVPPTSMPAAAADVDAADLETPPPPTPTSSATAATIVLPHGMDSPQWSQAAELAVVQGQQQGGLQQHQQQQQQTAATAAAAMAAAAGQSQQPLLQHTRSASPLRPKVRLGAAAPPPDAGASAATVGAAPAERAASSASASSDLLPPPRAPSPSLAGRLGNALRSAADAVVRAASPARAGNGAAAAVAAAGRAASPRAGGGGSSGSGSSPRRSPSPSQSQPDTLELMAALATASALSHVDSGLLPGWPAVSFPRASAGQAPQQQPGERQDERQDPAAPPLPASLAPPSAPTPPTPAAEGRSTGSSSSSMWSSWRRELEEVTPPPPALPSSSAAEGEARAGADKEGRRVAGGSCGGAAARRPSPPPSPQPQSQSPQRKRPLRTSSPERAAAAAAALRLLRMQMDGLDDDGLASGAYGSGSEFYGSRRGDADASAAGGTRSGSADVAAARMARGTGGLSPGLQTRGQQLAPNPPPWDIGGGRSGGSGGGARQKQPLRTASPERVAAAAAAMRQLRAEMGLPPNDGRDQRGPTALVPRDWRRELDAAAAVPEPDESSGEEQEPAPAYPRDGGGRGFRHAPASAAVAVPRPRSPRNWRDQLEGRGQHASVAVAAGPGSGGDVPSDWRARVESGASAASASSSAATSTCSPGRSKLTAAERAERDARLQDWRARV